MDSLLNSPLLFRAGNDEYIKAGLSQAKVTEKYLIREDGSSFQHYIFAMILSLTGISHSRAVMNHVTAQLRQLEYAA